MLSQCEAVRQNRNQLRSVRRLLPLILFLFLPRNGVAGGLETFAQALIRHHIELTKPALIDALRDSNDEVRGLAAWQLLEMKATDALPQILQAVGDERDPETKVNLAAAAAHFGAKEGTAELARVCHNSAVPEWVRTDAARHLFDNQDRSCMPDLLTLMTAPTEAHDRIAALGLLSQRSDLTETESAQIMRASLEMLHETDPFLRVNASIFLTNLHDTSAIPYMRAAIQVESEEAIKSQMETSLESLLALKPRPHKVDLLNPLTKER